MVRDAGPGADMDGFSGPAGPADRTLITVLADARGAGFLGPGPLAVHLDHARAMAGALPETPTGLIADLGTGGGVPGLVLATVWSTAELTLRSGRPVAGVRGVRTASGSAWSTPAAPSGF